MPKSNSVREINRQTKKIFSCRFFEIFRLDMKINNLWRQEVYTFDVSSKMLLPPICSCGSDCSVWAEVNVKQQLSVSSHRPEDVKTLRVVLFPERGRCWECSFGTTNFHSLCFPRNILLFWRPRCRDCRVVDIKLPIFAQLTSQPGKNEKVAHETETPFTL